MPDQGLAAAESAHSPAKPAIRVHGVGKTYRMWASPSARLSVPLLLRAARASARVWPALGARLLAAAGRRVHTHDALQDISLELMPGQALGIIGLNGSGKSTLLQIVAGVLPPTSGTVEVNGRVAALLELGSGFNPELSGRENIRINAAILGLTQKQIEQRMGEIIAFADIGDYVDEPVKTYSSGMALRLAFAVQVHIDPEVLIVDEALAVGDAAFQAKAMARIDRILQQGTTLLFVGHDLNAVKAFCQQAMLLEGGRVVCQGLPDDVTAEYLRRAHAKALRGRQASGDAELASLEDGYALGETRVLAADLNGVHHLETRYGEPVQASLRVRLGPELANPALIFDLLDMKGMQLTGRRIALPPQDATSEVIVRIGFDATFQQGLYRVRTRVVDAPSLEQTVVYARQEGRLSLEVMDDSRHLFTGLLPLPMTVDIAG